MPDPPTAESAASRPREVGAPRLGPGELEFELLEERPTPGLVRRLLTTLRHFAGALSGALIAHVRERPPERRRGVLFRGLQLLARLLRLFVARRFSAEPFPVQLRRRLEALGPTYIKLGQILSLREDILPREITDELQNLLDRLPAISSERFRERVEEELEQPAEAVFTWIEARPLGSASIGQTHRAALASGETVILKLVKPGIREILVRDSILLRLLGRILQRLIPQVQPRRIIDEFCDYTLREADLNREADNAETFSANFKDVDDIVFPRIYRAFSTQNLLCMEFLDGVKPSARAARELPEADRDRIIDLGAMAIIRMLYRDGFFHADLHPGNLLILEGARAGFIDLGMVGRFSEEVRRTLLYYYYCLVMGDAANAARYLASIAEPGPGGDRQGFRRNVEEICRRWRRSATATDFSIGRMILESVASGAEYRMYFPVEMVLMVKAIVTFEGVGHLLQPGFDVVALSRDHIGRIFRQQFSPLRIGREALRGAPELVDALVKAPSLVIEGLRVLEQSTEKPAENRPLTGLRATVLAGFCVVGGALVAALQGPWGLWAALFAAALILAVRRER